MKNNITLKQQDYPITPQQKFIMKNRCFNWYENIFEYCLIADNGTIVDKVYMTPDEIIESPYNDLQWISPAMYFKIMKGIV